jgi:sugar/nucleoside kinase (ribokinase family)
MSEDEAATIIGRAASSFKLRALGPEIILITKGKAGTIVWSKDSGVYAVPAYKTRVQDPTGAGDALVGAFLATWVHTGDLTWSAAIGSAVASFVVEKVGPSNFGTPTRVERRATRIFDGIVRMQS